MKINKNFVIALAILIMVLIIFIWLLKSGESNTHTVSSIIENSSAKNLNKTLNTSSYIVQNSNEDNDKYVISIYYPRTKYDTLNSYITDMLSEQIKLFKDQISELSKGSSDIKKYSLKINFEAEERGKYLAFAFFVEKDIGQIHDVQIIYTINYDLKSRNILNIEDMEKKYNGFLANISRYCYDELSKDKNVQKYGAIDMLKEGTKPIKENFEDVIIMDKYIKVYFETYKMAPYVLGSFEIKIPISIFNEQ